MRFQGGISKKKFGWESNSLEIGSLAGRVSTHRAMDKLVLSKMPKENYQMIKNKFSFLMKYFYNHPKVLQGRIHSHMLPPTHPWCLVTPMTLVLFVMPQSYSKFEWFPLTSKCILLVDIFIPDMSYFHRFAIRSVIRSAFVIEYSIIVVITCMESISKWHIVYF